MFAAVTGEWKHQEDCQAVWSVQWDLMTEFIAVSHTVYK